MPSDGGSGHDSRRFTTVLALLCVLLAIVVVALAVQNLRLKRSAHGSADEPPMLAVGDRVAPLVLVDESFARYTLDWSLTSRTVLFVFTSTCPACAETQPVWTELAERLSVDGGVRVVGLQLDRGTGPDASAPATPASAYPFPVYAIGVEENVAFHQLVPFVPATIVLDASGKVREVRFEILDRDAADEIATELEDRAR